MKCHWSDIHDECQQWNPWDDDNCNSFLLVTICFEALPSCTRPSHYIMSPGIKIKYWTMSLSCHSCLNGASWASISITASVINQTHRRKLSTTFDKSHKVPAKQFVYVRPLLTRCEIHLLDTLFWFCSDRQKFGQLYFR